MKENLGYFFCMSQPEKEDWHTMRVQEMMDEKEMINRIEAIDRKRRKNYRGQYTADLIYEGQEDGK